jgi:hypothetical protein
MAMSVNYVNHHAGQKGASGEWLHDDDGSPNCSVPFRNNKARKASPVVIPNDALLQNCRSTIADDAVRIQAYYVGQIQAYLAKYFKVVRQ